MYKTDDLDDKSIFLFQGKLGNLCTLQIDGLKVQRMAEMIYNNYDNNISII